MQAKITIAQRARLNVAPEGFFFEAEVDGFDATGPRGRAVYDDRFHDLYYFWNFDDPYTFKAPENLPPEHRNANIAYGPVAAHTFRRAGQYNVSVLVVEPSSGKFTTTKRTVTVGNPDVVFGGQNTIFVDTTGTGKGAPAGALIVKALDRAVGMVQGNDQTPKRIMLRRGQSFTF